MDGPTTVPSVTALTEVLKKIDTEGTILGGQRAEALSLLEEFECWDPYFLMIKENINDASKRHLSDFTSLAKVQNLYLENVFAAAETCGQMIDLLKTDNSQFTEEALSQIIEEDDFTAEASIRSSIWDKFSEKQDRIDCLERLCLLYEKKTHNDALLAETYETLLDVDSKNVKALRYFKILYSHNNEWEEVIKYLRKLLECVNHKVERYRVAQELAVIYLYQLDLPHDAIKVLERHCEESPLDTSTILYDAHHRLGNWGGCLKVLRESLLHSDEDHARAVLHYKIAGILRNENEIEEAHEDFKKAATLWPDFLDSYEGVISTAVKLKKFDSVIDWLKTFETKIIDRTLVEQLQQATKRLNDGMAQEQNG